jgi:hypothetical protein
VKRGLANRVLPMDFTFDLALIGRECQRVRPMIARLNGRARSGPGEPENAVTAEC